MNRGGSDVLLCALTAPLLLAGVCCSGAASTLHAPVARLASA